LHGALIEAAQRGYGWAGSICVGNMRRKEACGMAFSELVLVLAVPWLIPELALVFKY